MKKIILFVIGSLFVIGFSQCKKLVKVPAATCESSYNDNSYADALPVHFELIDEGNSFGDILNIGICYSTKPNPVISDDTIILHITEYDLNCDRYLKNLKSNTAYYFRPFIETKDSVSYGIQNSGQTESLDFYINSSFYYDYMYVGKDVDLDWSSNILSNIDIELWQNNTFVTTLISNTENDGNETVHISLPKGFDKGEGYKFVIKSHNVASQKVESETFTLTENDVPDISLDTINEVKYASASLVGSLNNLGMDDNCEFGICYSSSNSTPTIDDETTSTDYYSSPDNYIYKTLKNLDEQTTYYARFFAQNSKGVGYSQVLSFTTTKNPSITLAHFPGEIRYGEVHYSLSDGLYYGLGHHIEGTGTYMNDIWHYSTSSNSWSVQTDFPLELDGATAYTIGNIPYIAFGGTYADETHYYPTNKVYKRVSSNWTEYITADIGMDEDIAVFQTSSCVYFATGWGGLSPNSGPRPYVWKLTSSFSQQSDFPSGARTRCYAFSVNNYGYVGGGYDENDYFSDLWKFDENTNSWTQVNDDGIHSCQPVKLSNGKVYVVLFWHIYEFDENTNSFKFVYEIPGDNVYVSTAWGGENIGNSLIYILLDNGDFLSFDPSLVNDKAEVKNFEKEEIPDEIIRERQRSLKMRAVNK